MIDAQEEQERTDTGRIEALIPGSKEYNRLATQRSRAKKKEAEFLANPANWDAIRIRAEEAAAVVRRTEALQVRQSRQRLFLSELTEPQTPFPEEPLEDGSDYKDWFDSEVREYLLAEYGVGADLSLVYNVLSYCPPGLTGVHLIGKLILAYIGATSGDDLEKMIWSKFKKGGEKQ
jgi:Rad3-related DNA helicase